MSQPSLSGFDWTSLDPETRAIVQDTTKRLHDLERRTGEAIIEIGRGLIDTKQRLGRGPFGLWLDAEFGWSDRTARRFMEVASRFGDLDSGQIVRFAPSALTALASDSVPDAIREEFIARAEAGEPIRHKDVKARLSESPPRLAVVDLDSGEILDEPEVAYEVVDPSDPASFLPGPTPIHRPIPAVSDDALSLSNGLIDAQAPATVARKLAECKSAILAAKRLLYEFDPERIVRYGGTPDAQASLDRIIGTATDVLTTATELRDQIGKNQKVRAIR